MVTLSQSTLQRTRASWHEDQELNIHQASMLRADVLATRERLIREVVERRMGPGAWRQREGCLRCHPDEQGVVWVVWARGEGDAGEALAVFTHPVSRLEGYRYVLEWHFAEVAQAPELAGRN